MTDDEPSFRPKALDRRDLQTPVTAGMRLLSPEDRDTTHARQRAQADGWRAWSPAKRRKMFRYALAGAIAVPLLNGVLSYVVGAAVGFRALWVQIPLAALAGAAIAATRPTRMVCGLVVGIVEMVALVAVHGTGGGIGFLWALMMHGLLFFCLGLAVGIEEELKAADGS